MKRREFITLLGNAAAWPIAARAQQPDQMRRIGVLMNRAANHPEGQAEIAAFQQALQQLGWIEGRNTRIDVRWGDNDVDRDRRRGVGDRRTAFPETGRFPRKTGRRLSANRAITERD